MTAVWVSSWPAGLSHAVTDILSAADTAKHAAFVEHVKAPLAAPPPPVKVL
jgi:hypothetical protein